MTSLFHFQLKDGLNFRLVLSAMRRGSPTLTLAFGVLLRNLCMNYSLQMFVGAAGVAVAGVMATVNSLASAIPVGCCNGFSTLASIYFGEEDRESLLDLAFSAMRIGLLSCAAATGFIMLMSKPFAVFFFPNDPSTEALAVRMFILGFTFLVPNVFYNLLLQSYRAQNRMLLVNILSFAETAVMGIFVTSHSRAKHSLFGTSQ